ncbi:unnamed protein product, partial [Rotaria sordida]
QPDDLPSKKPNMIPILIEKAACGIVEEGKYIGKPREAEKLAEMLREKKNAGVEEVWKLCAYIYTLESFLYKTLNAAMRLVGDKEHEQVWRSKVRTLGPFCLLLWDDPFNTKLTAKKTLYRGASLTKEQIAAYAKMAEDDKDYGSFQAYISCSRNRDKAEEFGNTLFIMQVEFAFIAELSSLSEYSAEEEELITPGVSFRVLSVKFDPRHKKDLNTFNTSSHEQTQSVLGARLASLNHNNLNDEVLRDLLRDVDLYNLTDADAVLLDDLLGFEGQCIRSGDINKEVRMVLLGGTGNG